VAGRNRVDTALMEVTPDLVVKAGAEGLLCAASLSRGIGVAVKVADGGARADAPALIHVLIELGLLDHDAVEPLKPHARPAVLGGGHPVGESIADFALHRA